MAPSYPKARAEALLVQAPSKQSQRTVLVQGSPRYPRIRNPVVSWLLTVATGLYVLFWSWAVANELNAAEEREIFNVQRWRRLFLLLVLVVFVALVLALQADFIFPLVVATVLLLVFYLRVQLDFGNYIKSKDRQLQTGASYSNAVFLFLFWFVANLGVLYMQVGINRVIRQQRGRP